jgi:hypothetical protein
VVEAVAQVAARQWAYVDGAIRRITPLELLDGLGKPVLELLDEAFAQDLGRPPVPARPLGDTRLTPLPEGRLCLRERAPSARA